MRCVPFRRPKNRRIDEASGLASSLGLVAGRSVEILRADDGSVRRLYRSDRMARRLRQALSTRAGDLCLNCATEKAGVLPARTSRNLRSLMPVVIIGVTTECRDFDSDHGHEDGPHFTSWESCCESVFLLVFLRSAAQTWLSPTQLRCRNRIR